MQKIVLNSITVTTTSDGINVENLENIGIQFRGAGIDAGNGVLTMDISNNGTDWETNVVFWDSIQTNILLNAPITSINLDADDSVFVYLPSYFSAKIIRLKITVTTDGSYTAIITGNKKA